MISDFEYYHGVVLRKIILEAGKYVSITADDKIGRVNCFGINENIGLYVKHSSRRLPPWQFTFLPDHVQEIGALQNNYSTIFMALVCGIDGIATISLDEFWDLNERDGTTTPFIRVDRARNTVYWINGGWRGKRLGRPRGVKQIMDWIE